MASQVGPWLEVGDRVFTRRYAFFDQQIGVVLGRGEALVIDTRVTQRMGREILADLAELTSDPVTVVVNTHWHHDHTFGNHVFRPVTIWGHERTPIGMATFGERMRSGLSAAMPDLASDLAEVVIDPPDQTFADATTIEVGGRAIDLRYLGRGHTDSDIVVDVPDAAVLFAGDLLEAGATPSFGDAYPLDWPWAVERLLTHVMGAVVPGHGDVGDRAFVEEQLAAFRSIADLARRVHGGTLELDAAVAASPFSPETSQAPLERALAQLRGELD
jgi:glyoxylase-like metal-dependent hydrolase (beta-lactamase superfamily II)